MIYIIFSLQGKNFAIPYAHFLSIEKIPRKNIFRVNNFVSIPNILKKELNFYVKANQINSNIFYIIRHSAASSGIMIPGDIFRLDQSTYKKDKGNSLILGEIAYKNKLITILSLAYIINKYCDNFIEAQFENSEENEYESNKDKLSVVKMENTKPLENTDEHREVPVSEKDEEKKKEIYSQIEIEIDKLKIRDIESVEAKYLIKSKTFAPRLFLIYAILISLTILFLLLFNYSTNKQKEKLSTDLGTIGNLESIIIKELQKKQEQEKAFLSEQLVSVQVQLDGLQKDRENFIKNQENTLLQKQKELENEYLNKLEEQKKLLSTNQISDEEYKKRINEISSSLETEKKKTEEEAKKEKEEYIKASEEREKTLITQKSEVEQKVQMKDQEIKKIEQEKSEIEQKLATSVLQQQQISEEYKRLKDATDAHYALRQKLNSFYKSILVQYQKQEFAALKKTLDDFFEFLLKNPQASPMLEDEKNFSLFIINTIIKQIDTDEIRQKKLREKEAIISQAKTAFSKKNYAQAYELYKKAFTDFEVKAVNEEQLLKDFETVVYYLQNEASSQELEEQSEKAYKTIENTYNNKNYARVISLAEDFVLKFSKSNYIIPVIEFKIKAQKNLEIVQRNRDALKLYDKALKSFKAKQYTDTYKYIAEIVRNYADTDVIPDVMVLLDSVNNGVQSLVYDLSRQAPDTSGIKKYGIISTSTGEFVLFIPDQYKKAGFFENQKLSVYRYDNETYKFIAVIEIIEITATYVKARILSQKELVKTGDIIGE